MLGTATFIGEELESAEADYSELIEQLSSTHHGRGAEFPVEVIVEANGMIDNQEALAKIAAVVCQEVVEDEERLGDPTHHEEIVQERVELFRELVDDYCDDPTCLE
ncbi:MAG: hypothetical protein HW383_310 [Candidatus Magasanikbacteria bacterium]|nr:hypothetical protein [Candidatus Magasanikbacteria bacterium]